ncbi:MAG: RadC family protein [Anaeromyxobacteraceae bacterium]
MTDADVEAVSEAPSEPEPTRRRAVSACHERLDQLGVRVLSDAELLTLLLSPTAGMNSTRDAALRLLDALPMSEIAWAPAEELQQQPGIGRARAAAIAAAFELGRRGAWSPPKRGERVLDPARVYELMRPLAHAEREEFHTVLLDVRGRLIKTVKVAEGSLTQCPVSPRDALREPVRIGAHGVVFVHNHPSGDAAASVEDGDLTERLRAASELVGVVARDHVIVATGGYFSFVEAGRWRR